MHAMHAKDSDTTAFIVYHDFKITSKAALTSSVFVNRHHKFMARAMLLVTSLYKTNLISLAML